MKKSKRLWNGAVFGVLLLAAASPGDIYAREEPMTANKDRAKMEALILTLVTDGDPGARQHAAQDLGEIGSKEVLYPLIYALGDSDQYVRGSASMALERIGDKSAIDPLLDAWDRIDTLYPREKDHLHDQRKCIDCFHVALSKLSGKDFGFDLKLWKKWRQEQVEKKQKEQKERDKDK